MCSYPAQVLHAKWEKADQYGLKHMPEKETPSTIVLFKDSVYVNKYYMVTASQTFLLQGIFFLISEVRMNYNQKQAKQQTSSTS